MVWIQFPKIALVDGSKRCLQGLSLPINHSDASEYAFISADQHLGAYSDGSLMIDYRAFTKSLIELGLFILIHNSEDKNRELLNSSCEL